MVSLHERASNRSGTGAEPIRSAAADRIDVRTRFPSIAFTISVCGAASNAGKTWLCESILRGLRAQGRTTLALKVTRTHLGDCPRGIETCGTCESLAGDFEIVRERALLDVAGKDTGRYFHAGADRVLWLLVKPSAVRAGVLAALAEVPEGSVLVAEGNSFRDYASAEVTLLALSRSGEFKASALHVIDRVDACVRHHRAAARPEASAASGKPLVQASEAWPFVLARMGQGLRS